MTKRSLQLGLVAFVACSIALPTYASPIFAQSAKTGETYRSPGGTTLRLLLNDSNIGPEVSLGELTFPPNSDSGEHAHGAIELLYVVSGTLIHTVNGKTDTLTAGMVGYVKPPDMIRHRTGADGAKVVVVWSPGAEAKQITSRWKKEP